jgi:hypothetical protein
MPHWDEPICEYCDSVDNPLIRADEVPIIADYYGYSTSGNDYGVRGGTVFHSAKERKAYDEKFRITSIVDKKSGKGKIIKEEARWQADVAAQNAGYKDHDNYRKTKKRDKQLKRGQLSSTERKIQV